MKGKKETFNYVLQRVKESNLRIPWYEYVTKIEKGTPRYSEKYHAPISVNAVIMELEKQNSLLLEVVKFYADPKSLLQIDGGKNARNVLNSLEERK